MAMIEDQQLMEKIREIYELVGKLANEIRLKSPSWPPGVLGGAEFSVLISAFLASLKKHYGLSVENDSMASRVLNAIEHHDMEVLSLIMEKTVSTLHQLSENDSSGFMFHFFWPQLYGELAKSDA